MAAAIAMGAMRVGGALAQAPTQPPLSPDQQACQGTILELTGAQLQWRTQAIALQRQIEELNRQLAEARKPPAAPSTAAPTPSKP